MTENRRIALNVIFSYARSVYAIALGLFAGRWTLMSLGHVDYGLVGVIGGLVVFVSFFNSLLSGAVSRFYAYNVGRAKTENIADGIENCRKWFNSALLIHTVLPVILMGIGYPIGEWAVRNYLTIPAERIEDCVWVWRFVGFSCFVSMLNVPFQAMYIAKQEIAELTIYSIATSTLNFFFLYYMVNHPGVWLVRFMGWTCFLSVMPQVIICVRAVTKYQECRFVRSYLWDAGRFREILEFAGSKIICAVSQLLSNQGSTILVNKMLGPVKNATMTVGHTVSGHCLTLSGAFLTSFSPAIMNAAGAGDLKRMRRLMYATCSISSAAVLIFALPLFLEVNEVMRLWLKTPPIWSGAICLLTLGVALADRISDGLWMGIFAVGKIFAFQTWEAILWFAVLPFAYIFVKLGGDVIGVGVAMLLAKSLAVIMKLYFSKKICDISVRYWIVRIALPLVVASIASLLVGLIPRLSMEASFFRVAVTTISIELVFLPLVWLLLLPQEAKTIVLRKFGPCLSMFRVAKSK